MSPIGISTLVKYLTPEPYHTTLPPRQLHMKPFMAGNPQREVLTHCIQIIYEKNSNQLEEPNTDFEERINEILEVEDTY